MCDPTSHRAAMMEPGGTQASECDNLTLYTSCLILSWDTFLIHTCVSCCLFRPHDYTIAIHCDTNLTCPPLRSASTHRRSTTYPSRLSLFLPEFRFNSRPTTVTTQYYTSDCLDVNAFEETIDSGHPQFEHTSSSRIVINHGRTKQELRLSRKTSLVA